MEQHHHPQDHDSNGRTDAEARAEFKQNLMSTEEKFPYQEIDEVKELLSLGYQIKRYNEYENELYTAELILGFDVKTFVTEHPLPMMLDKSRTVHDKIDLGFLPKDDVNDTE